MVLRLGLEADLKVTLELKKDTWQWQPHWFLSEADHRLVGGGWDRVCVARGGKDWAQARSQEDHHLQQVALTFSIYSKINFSHISELGTRISSPLSCWRSVSRATLSSGETAESNVFSMFSLSSAPVNFPSWCVNKSPEYYDWICYDSTWFNFHRVQ